VPASVYNKNNQPLSEAKPALIAIENAIDEKGRLYDDKFIDEDFNNASTPDKTTHQL
jgi:hypothetical protein